MQSFINIEYRLVLINIPQALTASSDLNVRMWYLDSDWTRILFLVFMKACRFTIALCVEQQQVAFS